MSQRLDNLEAALRARFADTKIEFKRERGEITLTVAAADYLAVADTLRDDPTLKFEQLMDLCSLDLRPTATRFGKVRVTASSRTCCRSA